MADEEHAHEIIIVKRHGDHEEGHHGGVWKIAFADFMTAMMAFFLVMWLISANDKTKATIASYFNPVKLVDTTTQPKGLEDAKAVESVEAGKKAAKPTPVEKAAAKETAVTTAEAAAKAESSAAADSAAKAENAAKAGGADAAASKAKEKRLAAAVIDDPYAALTEIAGTKGAGEKSSAPPTPSNSTKTAVNAITRKGGEAFRDPFAPPPPLQPEVQIPPSEAPEADAKAVPPGGNPDMPPAPKGAGKEGTSGKETGATVASLEHSKAASVQAANEQSAELKAQITAAAKAAGLDKSGPQVEVRKADGGILISLTDSEEFEMFASGSAVPGRKVVLMMDRIAQILKSKPGKIIIRGFTDNRPYKSGHYDNWRLSLDRAQVMHYMLVRGGFDETRIAHIEGFADRNLKSPENPASAINRRIEILVMGDAQ
ncbi:MAG: flagellar motor protein MotB [Beijerinckiaceae bacterium]|nr:flagellar motor protein MotB [Beijerinckiaceae bacterium]